MENKEEHNEEHQYTTAELFEGFPWGWAISIVAVLLFGSWLLFFIANRYGSAALPLLGC